MAGTRGSTGTRCSCDAGATDLLPRVLLAWCRCIHRSSSPSRGQKTSGRSDGRRRCRQYNAEWSSSFSSWALLLSHGPITNVVSFLRSSCVFILFFFFFFLFSFVFYLILFDFSCYLFLSVVLFYFSFPCLLFPSFFLLFIFMFFIFLLCLF